MCIVALICILMMHCHMIEWFWIMSSLILRFIGSAYSFTASVILKKKKTRGDFVVSFWNLVVQIWEKISVNGFSATLLWENPDVTYELPRSSKLTIKSSFFTTLFRLWLCGYMWYTNGLACFSACSK